MLPLLNSAGSPESLHFDFAFSIEPWSLLGQGLPEPRLAPHRPMPGLVLPVNFVQFLAHLVGPGLVFLDLGDLPRVVLPLVDPVGLIGRLRKEVHRKGCYLRKTRLLGQKGWIQHSVLDRGSRGFEPRLGRFRD